MIIHTYTAGTFNMPTYTNCGCGKEANINWSMVTCQGSTRSELPRGLLAPCRRTLGIERHRYAIAGPDKLGTDPMACGDYKLINGRRRQTREESRKYQIQPEYGDEQADAGRDCRTRLARPNSQARTRTGKCYFFLYFPVQLTTFRTGNLTRLYHTLAVCVTIHT